MVRLVLTVCFFLIAGAQHSEGSCQWAVLRLTLGDLGAIGNAPRWAAATSYGKYSLDTSGEKGPGIFFGNPGSAVRVSRKGMSWPVGAFYANWPRVNFGEGWSIPNWWARPQPWSVGYPSYAPNPRINFVSQFPTALLAANAICTRIWICDPRGLTGTGWSPQTTRFSGGQDAVWSARSTPAVNVYGDFGDSPVEWAITGWPVAYNGGYNYNRVTLISISSLFPCDMMKDFLLPASEFGILPNSDGTVKLSWKGNWGCNGNFTRP